MYCIKCGADNINTAKFCRKCGELVGGDQQFSAAVDIEEQTKIAGRRGSPQVVNHFPDDDEIEIFSITPTLMFVKVGYAITALGGLFLVALFSAAFTSVNTWIAILFGMMLFLIPAFYHLRVKMVSYKLTDSTLEIDEGFISRTTRAVPVRRIQDVTVSSSITQRMLGIGNLVVDNASEEGGNVILKNIRSPKRHAEILLEQIRRVDK